MKRLFSILTAAALLVFTACGSPPSAETPESAEGQQIRLTVGDIQIDITLNGSQAAAALVQMLPLELTLIERNYFAKGMLLPDPLPDTEQTTRAYAVGDLGYWADGQNLAIFYDDIFAQTSVPIIPLGRAENGAEQLSDISGTATLELLSDRSAGADGLSTPVWRPKVGEY